MPMIKKQNKLPAKLFFQKEIQQEKWPDWLQRGDQSICAEAQRPENTQEEI